MEFIVPVALFGTASDQYRMTLDDRYKIVNGSLEDMGPNQTLIKKFCEREWEPFSEPFKQAQALAQTLHDITINMDFIDHSIGSNGDDGIPDSMVANWYTNKNAKFKWLALVLDALRSLPTHVVIVWKRAGLDSKFETFLRGINIPYTRADQITKSEEASNENSLMVTLLSADGSGVENITRIPSVLITLDQSIDVNVPFIQSLRKLTSDPARPVPVLSVEIPNTLEHVRRCLLPAFDDGDRLRYSLHAAATLAKSAGQSKGLPALSVSAGNVVRFISMNGDQNSWPLSPIGKLDDKELWALVQSEMPLNPEPAIHYRTPPKKRKAQAAPDTRDEDPFHFGSYDEDNRPTKKTRLAPPGEGEQGASLTHITDSAAGHPSNIYSMFANSIAESWFRRQMANRDDEIKAKDNLLAAESNRVAELQKTMGELEYRFEEQSKEFRGTTSKIEELEKSLDAVRKRKESRETTITTLKESMEKVKEELTGARDRLAASEIPEIAEMEKVRREREAAEEKARKANKRAEDFDQMIGYLRHEYDQATARVYELNQENEEFRTRVQKLEKTASGEITKAREMNLDSNTKYLQQQNIALKAIVEERERVIKRKDEELKQRRNAMATRGGSVPRSPRVGPMSRGGSPAPDRRVGVLKANHK